MTVETVIYRVEAKVRIGRTRKPITQACDAGGMTLAESKAIAQLMLAELLALNPGWAFAEAAIHYNVFFTV